MEKTEEKEEVKENPIAEAKALAERIEAANKVSADLLEKHEALKAEQIVSGESEAGKQSEEQPDQEQIIKDRCNEQLKGLGMKI